MRTRVTVVSLSVCLSITTLAPEYNMRATNWTDYSLVFTVLRRFSIGRFHYNAFFPKFQLLFHFRAAKAAIFLSRKQVQLTTITSHLQSQYRKLELCLLYTTHACAQAQQAGLSDDLYLRVVSIGNGRRTFRTIGIAKSWRKCKERTEHSDGKPAKNRPPKEAKARLDRVVIINLG